MAEVIFFWEEPVSLDLVGKSWEDAFGGVFDSKVWDWRFKMNPYGNIIYAAYILEDGMVACYYAVSPIDLISPNNKVLKSGLMTMGFTNPKFQGKGYYLLINKQLNKKLKDLGFDCIFGFSNFNSHYSYRKYLDWEDIGLLTNFRLIPDYIKRGLSRKSVYNVRKTNLTTELLEKIAGFKVTRNKYVVSRNTKLLKWRLLDTPHVKYKCFEIYDKNEVIALVIYKVFNSTEMDIMEIFYKSEELISDFDILSSITNHALRNDIQAINIWSNLYSEEHLLLEKIGFREEKVCTHFGVINLSGLHDVTKIKQWHYRFIDSDVY